MRKLLYQANIENGLVPVILSGGKGSRLWPLSRECYPKQYLNIQKENKYSLLQNTYLRLIGINNLKQPIIVCNEEQRFIVAEQMRKINVQPKSILLEPVSRNTAPAIALAALMALEDNQDPFLLILSSDHQIEKENNFRETIKDSLYHAKRGKIVTFGVVPTRPETGYGYIKSFQELTSLNKSSPIQKFIEKPDKEKAKELIKDKSYSWNSGIFCSKASVIIKELKNYHPKIVDACTEALKNKKIDLDFHRLPKEHFAKCEELPIDIAVMEKTSLGVVFALEAGWNDIGDWKSVWENSKKDINGNTVIGKNILNKTKNSYIRSSNRLIATIDIDNLIIIDTEDAILIANKDSSQKVKGIVENLKENNIPEGKNNKKMFRPWGSYTSIDKHATWHVKRININPFSSLSLQLHNHRSEHWVVVSGTAKVEVDEKVSYLKENESIYVPQGSKHRLSNPFKQNLAIIEVQSGSYLGEDDIVRFEDNYGRITNNFFINQD